MLSVVISFNNISFCSGHLDIGFEASSFDEIAGQVTDSDGGALILAVSDLVGLLLSLVFAAWMGNVAKVGHSSFTTVRFAIFAVSEVDLALPDNICLPVTFDLDTATPL